MDVDLALLADAATVDASGKLNILGVFDRVTTGQFPARHGRISLVLRFTAGVAEMGVHEVEIRLRDPKGGEVLRLSGKMELGPGATAPRNGMRVPHVLNLDGLVFEMPGAYAFDVAVDGDHHVSIPLFVTGPLDGGGAMA